MMSHIYLPYRYCIMAQVLFRYYGISPWEIEVLYGYFRSRFNIQQSEIEQEEPEFVSRLDIYVPVDFSDEFFEWFDYRRWEKVKSLFKEMKRRRGSGNAVKIRIVFRGTPNITFVIDAGDRQWFDNSIEKIDFVLELLPYHIEKLPAGCTGVIYTFDAKTTRWRLYEAHAENRRYRFTGGGWAAPLE